MTDVIAVLIPLSIFVFGMVLVAFIAHAIDRFFELVRVAERIEKMLRDQHG